MTTRAAVLDALVRATEATVGNPSHVELLALLVRTQALPPGLKVVPRPRQEPRPPRQVAIVTFRPVPSTYDVDPVGERMREAEGARALLLEVIRRAAFDWVLYRTSTRIEQSLLAKDAYTWIFDEDEDHANFKLREREGKHLTAFVVICDSLDLDPDVVRGYIRNLTPNRVMSSGRPPENSRASEHHAAIEVHARIPDVGEGEGFDFDALLGALLDG